MKYAKIIEGNLEIAPQNKGAVINYNTNIELMEKDGYKELIEALQPITNRHYHIEYTEKPTQIKEVIVYDETQEEADAREKQEEHERIQRLNMTKLDFYKYALQPNGIDYAKLQEILHTSEEMNACWQLCERVYRGDEVLCKAVEKFLPSIDLDEIFKERGQ